MTLAAANQKYFDAVSSSYDNKPWFAKVNSQVTEALRSDLSWIGIPLVNTSDDTNKNDNNNTKEVKLLDYACGTGLMTRILAPYVTTTLAIDISPNMVSTYNAHAQTSGTNPPPNARAVTGNLFDKADPSPPALTGPEWHAFDIATVGFGFHHFEDVVYAAGQLRQRLRPGGVLVINDFLEGGDYLAVEGGEGEMDEQSRGSHHGSHHVHHHSSGHGHGHGHDHTHSHGHENDDTTADPSAKLFDKMNDSIVVPHFSIEGVRKFFTEAGFVDVDVKTMEGKAYMEFAGKKMWRTVLFARGRRPFDEDKGKSEL